jgi:cysteine desulfurase
VSPKKNGIVRPLDYIEAIKENTILISLMYVNNEVGTLQPVGNLGKLIREYREKNNTVFPYLHTDACQAGNYFLVSAPKLKADLITINASKVYGPKGVGALYVKNNVEIESIQTGGGQERGLRSGTESPALIIGLVESFILAQNMREEESARLRIIQSSFFTEINNRFKGISINGDLLERAPNNIHITVPGIQSEELVVRLSAYGIEVSAKSACSNRESDGSYVILEMGGTEQEARQTLRITMGKQTQQSDIEYFLKTLTEILEKYRN